MTRRTSAIMNIHSYLCVCEHAYMYINMHIHMYFHSSFETPIKCSPFEQSIMTRQGLSSHTYMFRGNLPNYKNYGLKCHEDQLAQKSTAAGV